MDGNEAADEHVRLPPQAAARYLSLRFLGQGGMGTAYRARDATLGRDVALKIVRQDLTDDPVLLKRFKREVRVLAGLDHPNVVSLYDIHEDEGMTFFTMEFVEGLPLDDYVAKHQCSLEEVVELFVQLARAISAVHGTGILHRDIKPQNVMVSKDGVVKLLDFGLARGIAGSDLSALTQSGHVVGTLNFMPPEVFAGNTHDERGDIYQVGVTMYQALTGRHPLGNEGLLALLGGASLSSVAPPSAHRPGVDGALDDLVLRTMAVTAEARFQSAVDLQKACMAMFEGSYEPSAPSPGADDARGVDEAEADTLPPTRYPAPSSQALSDLALARPSRFVWGVVGVLALSVVLVYTAWFSTGPEPFSPQVLAMLRARAEAESRRGAHAQAFAAYLQLARAGDAEGQCTVGECYRTGTGVFQDFGLAASWFAKAAEQGSTKAQRLLGHCYATGQGVPQNLGQAVEWFERAAAGGDAEARRRLAELAGDGGG